MMLREHGLRRALQHRLLRDLAFAPSHRRRQGQQSCLGFLEACLQVTMLCLCVGMGAHHKHTFLPAEFSTDTCPAHFIPPRQQLLAILG